MTRNGKEREGKVRWVLLFSMLVLFAPTIPMAADVPPDRWKGEYYNNQTLSGNPALTRDDGTEFLPFDWKTGSPGEGIPADHFSVRWTREKDFSPGYYRFTVRADDGVKFWIDGRLKLDQWIDQSPTTYTVGPIYLSGRHTLKMEYYENGGGTVAQLSWEEAGLSPSPERVFFFSGWEVGHNLGALNSQSEYPVQYSWKVSDAKCKRHEGALRNGVYHLVIEGRSLEAYAYSYHHVFDVNIPIEKGMKLSYWIYHDQGGPTMAVDGHFNDGINTLRDFNNNGFLTDQNGVRIHPGLRQDLKNQWVYVEVDLSKAAGKTLAFLLFAFDNGVSRYQGQYRAYVDDLRIFSPRSDSCDQWVNYVPFGQRRAGQMFTSTGQVMSQWATRPRGSNGTDIIWGDPAKWPPDGAEENEIREFRGKRFIWLNAYRDDRMGYRFAIRTTKATFIDSSGSYTIIDDPNGTVDGQPIAYYDVCGDPYTLKVWGWILDKDGNRSRRWYWAHTVTPPQPIPNSLWIDAGPKTRQAVRQTELWWDSDGNWVIGGGNLTGDCAGCQNLSSCDSNCNPICSNPTSDDCRQCKKACHARCTNSNCWPDDDDESIRYGRSITNAKDTGLVWTYDDWEHNARGGLRNAWTW